jgi:hypothetical protein
MINVSTAMAKREIVRQSSVGPGTTIAMRTGEACVCLAQTFRRF